MSVKIRVLFIMPCEQRPTNPSDLKKFDGRWTVQSTKHLGTTAKQTDRTAAALLPESDDGQLQSLGLEPVYGEYEDEWLQSFSCNSILPLRVLIRRLYAFICQKKTTHTAVRVSIVFLICPPETAYRVKNLPVSPASPPELHQIRLPSSFYRPL